MSNNTILISGTAQCVGNEVHYDVFVYGNKKGEPLQFVRPYAATLPGYATLWQVVKVMCENYFEEPTMSDGAYTTYFDHLIALMPAINNEQLKKDYEAYCIEKRQMNENPLTFNEWVQLNSLSWDDTFGPNPYTVS